MKAVYRNTKEVVGAIVEVSSSMKLRSNMRPVSVKLSREDRRLLEEIDFYEMESYAAVESFGPVGGIPEGGGYLGHLQGWAARQTSEPPRGSLRLG